ncbi:MAG: DoxX family protein, partial [Polyangiaceae bacterium]
MNAPPSDRLRQLAAFLLRPAIGQPSRATFLVRLAAGGVFVSSGLVKLLFDNQGPGRFAKLGLPAPAALSTFVSVTEIVCGAL